MTFKQIETELYKMYGVNPREKRRTEEITKIRFLLTHCLFYYSSEIRSMSKITKFLGHKQHGTTYNALYEFDNWCKFDKGFKIKADRFISHILENTKHYELELYRGNRLRKDSLKKRIKQFRNQLKMLESN